MNFTYSTRNRRCQMKTIEHDTLGKIQVVKSYMTVTEPVLFTCTFDNDPTQAMYLGLLFEEFQVSEFEVGSSELIKNYYFAPVSPSDISILESGHGDEVSLSDIFITYPKSGMYALMWCSHRKNMITGHTSDLWHKRTCAAPYYRMPEGQTLCTTSLPL